MEDEVDVWRNYLGIKCGSYNAAIDSHILAVAKMIVQARENNTHIYMTDIAEHLGISETHAELIQYILLNAPGCFTYGTSPRGMFVDDITKAKKFVNDYENEMQRWERGAEW